LHLRWRAAQVQVSAGGHTPTKAQVSEQPAEGMRSNLYAPIAEMASSAGFAGLLAMTAE